MTATNREAAEAEIRAMVDRETRAWNAKDAGALADLFHPDMVWPWPPSPSAHDPEDWVMVLGRFDRARWMAGWQAIFDTCTLAHNHRRTVKVTLSQELDGALAVVDIDTLWVNDATGARDNWKGRVGKVYSKLPSGEWKMTMHTGVLDYAAR